MGTIITATIVSNTVVEITMPIFNLKFKKYLYTIHTAKKLNSLKLSTAKYSIGAASNEKYAIFATGLDPYSGNSTKAINTVDVYDTDLVHIQLSDIPDNSWQVYGNAVGEYLIFYEEYHKMNIYNSSLVYSSQSYGSNALDNTAPGHIGEYAIFAGGGYNNNTFPGVEGFNDSLVSLKCPSLSMARYNCSTSNTKDYMIVAGGCDSLTSTSAYTDAYNSSLLRFAPMPLSRPREVIASASINNYAIFAGGNGGTFTLAFSNIIEVYNNDLVCTTNILLSIPRSTTGASTKDYAIFAGGVIGDDYSCTNVVDCFNKALVRTAGPVLDQSKMNISGLNFLNYALFGGGRSSDIIDVYTD